MRKTIAILLSLVMLLGIGTMALATDSGTTLPDKSTYEFKFQAPNNIIAGKDTIVPVTFKTLVLGAAGYTNVRYQITNAVAPTSGAVTFKAKDAANETISFINYGIFTPSANFALPAQYNATTDWTMNFSKEGTYTINFKAYDENDYKIAEASQQITVTKGGFVYTVPADIVADEEIAVNVAFVSGQDYNNVHFEFQKTAGTGDVQFKAQDTNNTWYTFTNSGTWGDDFDITAPYNVSTPWKLTFSEAGSYTIAFKLVNESNEVLAQGSQDITVKEPSDVEDDEDDDNDDGDVKGHGKTHGLMNALKNHLKDKKNGKDKAEKNSTARLMELLQQRGITLQEIIDSLEELESAIAENGGTDEDYTALGKMYALKGEKFCTYVNDNKVEFDVKPVVEKGRTLVPFRKIAEELGAEVEWIAAEKKIIVTKDTTTVTITLGQTTATIDKDGTKTTATMDVPAKIYKNRTLVPLRFLSESLDTAVDYYPEGALVVVKTKGAK